MTALRYTMLWLGLLGLAVLNGAARERLYRDALGEHRAQQGSVGVGVVLFFGFTWLADRWWPWGAATTALGVGVIWLVLTVAFEFFMVVVLAGKPVEVARAQYDARSGNLWPFLLVAILLIPLAVWALHEGRGPG